MRRRGVLTVVYLISAAACPAQTVTAPAPRPDIFLITIDTLRSDHVHCYGYARIETPGIDSLANDGVRFTQAFTPSPITNTSHASILTGLMPGTHRVTDFGMPLAPEYPTLPELLKSRGYTSAAFIGSVILDSRNFAPGLDRGFDHYDNFEESKRSKSRWNRLERRAGVVAEHAEVWLESHRGKPRFVWVHFYDPHDPYEPPLPYSQTYKDRLYDGEIAYADSVLASFLGYLKKRGRYENSMIIVVGDHGEGLGEHHEDTHGIFLYDSTTHVPLIVKLPDGQSAGKVVEAQVSTLDILPTVLDALRLPQPNRIEGMSLLSDLTGRENRGHVVLGETDYPLRFGWAPLFSVRAEERKLIDAPRPEFYDLHADPAELHNAYAPWDSRVQELRAISLGRRNQSPPSKLTAGAVPQETIDELQALGYLGRNDTAGSTNVAAPSMLPDPKDHIEEQNLLHRAMIAQEDGRLSEAHAGLEKVLELNPNFPVALRQLGELELNGGEYANAALHLKKAMEMAPNDATLALDEGRALEKLDDLAGARAALEASLKSLPGQFSARLLLGQLCLRLKDPKAAEDQLESARLLQPRNKEVQFELAKSQVALGKFGKALPTLESLAESEPRTAEVFDLLSSAYAGVGKSDAARHAQLRADLLRTGKPK